MGSRQVSQGSSGADELEPMIDQWYLRQDTRQKFVVTDYDEQAGTVEIQTAEGDLDEIDDEAWRALPLVLAEQSQDWTAPIDNEAADDDITPRPGEGVVS